MQLTQRARGYGLHLLEVYTHQCPESPVSYQCKSGPGNQPSKSAVKVAQLQHTGPQLPKRPELNQLSRQVEDTRGLSKLDATQQQGHWSRPGQNPSCHSVLLQLGPADDGRTVTSTQSARPPCAIRVVGFPLHSPEKYHLNRRFFNVEFAQVVGNSAIHAGNIVICVSNTVLRPGGAQHETRGNRKPRNKQITKSTMPHRNLPGNYRSIRE